MNSLRNIAASSLILVISSFGLGQVPVTDTHGGDFVIVSGTTTYESLPFIETFSELVQNQVFLKDINWVTANWESKTSTTDDYFCASEPDCDGNDGYWSVLSPADSFFLSNK